MAHDRQKNKSEHKFIYFFFQKIHKTWEKGAGVSKYLTVIIKVNSETISWDHVTAVQSSRHTRLLATQGFCSRCTNQQPGNRSTNDSVKTCESQSNAICNCQVSGPSAVLPSVMCSTYVSCYDTFHSTLHSSHIQTHICHQTDVPCPHGRTESKTTSLYLVPHAHRGCLCGAWTRVNDTPKAWWLASSSQGLLQSKSNNDLLLCLSFSFSVRCRSPLVCCVCLMTSGVNVVRHTVFTRRD